LTEGPIVQPVSSPRRVAIVHDWLTGMRGGEKVLEALCELYPGATLYTLVRVPGSVSPAIEARRIVPSFAQVLPAAGRLYRTYLPLYPAAVECFDLDGYDLVISSSHCAVKSVISPGAVHICYCHSPMRYAWDQFDAYFGPRQVGPVASRLLRPIMAGLARWDVATAVRVDRFVANSAYVAARIRRYYNRGSTVVYPPVDTTFYRPATHSATEPSFLIVSALVPYKRVDVAIEACRRIGVPLKIVGRGPEQARLEQLATGGRNGGATGTAQFLGWCSDEEVRELYQRAAGVLLPGIEDFGMVPVEAQACGTPVVALDAGGARETVRHGVTGILAPDDSIEAFAAAVDESRRTTFDRETIRANAERFSRERFLREFPSVVTDALSAADARSARATSSIAAERPSAGRPS
jgi:glycosyltransferase involved in cell wall biosynthesis